MKTLSEQPMLMARLAIVAGQIVLETPRRKNPHSYSAYVRWDLIKSLESILNEAGFDMDARRKRIEQKKGR